MKTIFERTEKIPDYALPYLINNDDSGLSAEDKHIIDYWYANYATRLQDNQSLVISPIEDDNGNIESHFSWSPAFGLACDVVDCTILILG